MGYIRIGAGVTSMLCLFTLTSGYLWGVDSIPENRTEVLDEWIKMDDELKKSARTWIQHLIPRILKSSSQLNLSVQCLEESLQLISGLKNLKRWAFSFIDSSAKMPEGILSANLAFFGEYRQCLDTVVPSTVKEGEVLFRGQYCSTKIRPPLPHKSRRYRLRDGVEELRNVNGSEVVQFLVNHAHLFYFMPFRAGFCIPSGCTANDLYQIINLAAKKHHLDVEVTHCEVRKETIHLSKIQIMAITCGSLLIVIVLIGTCFEKYSDHRKIQFHQWKYRVLLSFSLIRNFNRLTSTKTSPGTFGCIYGIRFLSIAWILMNHSYIFSAWFLRSYRNAEYAQYVMTEPLAQIFVNGSEAVDSFFFMGGMLLSYLTIKWVKVEKMKFSLKKFLFHRFWRIGPTYYLILLLGMLVPLMGSGPLFQETMQESVYPCYKHWWKNLLFINNFYHLKDMCWLHTWYISCDVQLYLSSVLVIFPLLRSEKLGVAINISIVFVSVAYTGLVTYLHDLAPSLMMSYPDPEDRDLGMYYSYGNPLSRAGPYYIGFFVGYILATKPKLKISKKVQLVGWCMAAISSGSVIFIYGVWFNVRSPTQLELLMYATFYKVAFTAGIAWMTLCCITGHGGIINDILSWKLWIPLSKLTFLMYIIQPMVQIVYISNFQTPQEYSHFHLIIQFFGFLGISGFLALLCNLLLESPLLVLEKVVRKTTSKGNIKPSSGQSANGDFKMEKLHQNGHDNKSYQSRL